MELFTDILLDTFLDWIKLIPILFLTYLAMEALEHYAGEKTLGIIRTSKNYGPLVGGLLGIIPQCGIAGGAANLYAARVITLGGFVSVIMATSDEMLPMLISAGAIGDIWRFILFKLIYGIIAGFAIDLLIRIIRKKRSIAVESDECIHEMCDREGCRCEDNIFLSALKHTIKVGLLIFAVSLILGFAVEYIGEERIASFSLFSTPVLGEVTTAVFGLIPNCSVSVMLTELYLNRVIGAGQLMSGLLTNGGIGLLVLYRMNLGKKNVKKNVAITVIITFLGIIGGIAAGLIFK